MRSAYIDVLTSTMYAASLRLTLGNWADTFTEYLFFYASQRAEGEAAMDPEKVEAERVQVVFGQEALSEDGDEVPESENRAAPSNCEDCD